MGLRVLGPPVDLDDDAVHDAAALDEDEKTEEEISDRR